MPAEQVFWRRVVSYNEWALDLPDPFYESKIIIASSYISIGCKELLEDFNFKYKMMLIPIDTIFKQQLIESLF